MDTDGIQYLFIQWKFKALKEKS